MQYSLLFCEKQVSDDGWSKGRPCHHTQGTAKQIWWLSSTLFSPSGSEPASSSSGGRVRAWVEFDLMMNNPSCDLIHNVNPPTEIIISSSSWKLTRNTKRTGLMLFLISISNFDCCENPASSHQRCCLDKHRIHTEQINCLLDMHRSSNYYLATS